ncbi:MAG: carboxylating nicotinate-nucleotide diphosphorylase [Actinomycetota bacterium]
MVDQTSLDLDRKQLRLLVQRTLVEDLADAGDVTSDSILDSGRPGSAALLAKSELVLAGLPVADAVFRQMDSELDIEWTVSDGARLAPGDTVGRVSGMVHSIMAAERVALNFVQHLSGVATLTSKFVGICRPHGVQLLCTRKTIPGLRAVQRYAVGVGGGNLHRAGLYDAILIKTNHCKLVGSIEEAVRRAKKRSDAEVEVEVTNLQELHQAARAGAERVLLDNADVDVIAEAVEAKPKSLFLEVSGGIDLDTAASIAACRPDAISVGRITHSAPAADLALHVNL